jgi:outer membrane protein TolC
MKAWVDFSEKSLQRSRELNRQGNESLTSVLEKEAQLKIAESNYQNRKSRLELCREVLFPSRDDIKSIER